MTPNSQHLETLLYQLCANPPLLDLGESDVQLLLNRVKKYADREFTTSSLDDIRDMACQTAADMTVIHPDFSILAARLALSALYVRTDSSFVNTMQRLYEAKRPDTGERFKLVSTKCLTFVQCAAKELDEAITHERDNALTYFGFKTLYETYLLRIDGQVIERPQHLFMRTAVGIHCGNVAAVLETYELMSRGYFIHASPTLFNACAHDAQLSSCFLLSPKSDSLEGIFSTLKDVALISKTAGGIGMHVHNIRARGTLITGTAGQSTGLVPMLQVFNSTAHYVDQGGSKRPGAVAVYLEPWHADIYDFLALKTNTGAEERKTRDLFFGLWTPDLFMRRVENDESWSLMCPHKCPGLSHVYGNKFDQLYEKYERQGLATRIVAARDLWNTIVDTQRETGIPYMLYKDSCNYKSNQSNLGTIKCSNLCAEIIEYCAPDETAVCNLASIALNKFVDNEGNFDYDKLYKVTAIVTRNLNTVIDINAYPTPNSKTSNILHRPIGIGVQGLGDLFVQMRFAYESDSARRLNRRIFETIYYAALCTSCDLAKEFGPYKTYVGSPASTGMLQYDLWNDSPQFHKWDWEELKTRIAKYGLYNSLLIAAMPTATTSQILGNSESFEPYVSNMYTRRVTSGEFQVVNAHLVRDLIERGLWTDSVRTQIIRDKGSVQRIVGLSSDIKVLYKTAWEISQKAVLDMARDRAAFIDQSQSLNIYLSNPTRNTITSMHFYGWKLGLKTGMYYLRTKPGANPIQITIDDDDENVDDEKNREDELYGCIECTMCSA